MLARFYQYDNHIEIMNPDRLYGKARPENFPTVNDYRNPIVSEAMKVMGYVNKFNRGIDRVQAMLKENGNPQAIFDINKLTAFEVSVKESRDENLLHDLFPGTKIGTKINEIQEHILEFCNEPKSFSEIAEYLGYRSRNKLKKKYIEPLLGKYLEMTVPDKPTSKLQKYLTIHKINKEE